MPVPIDEIASDQRVRLINPSRGLVVAARVRLALGPWSRARGLLGGPPLASDEALLLRPCNAVHTFFMGYAIDVLFVGSDGVVLAVRPAMGPWRMTRWVAGARATIELPAGTLATTGTAVGDQVAFESVE